MLIKVTPGRVTVTEDEIIIEGFTFKVKCDGKRGNEKIEAGGNIIELQKVAIKWAMNRLAEELGNLKPVKQSGP